MSGSLEHRSDLPQTDTGQPKTQNDPKPFMEERQIAYCALFTCSFISKISLQLTIHVSSHTACGISQRMHHCTLGTVSNNVIIGCFCTINAEIQPKCSIIKCLQIIGWFGLNEDNWKQQTSSGFHIYYHCYF